MFHLLSLYLSLLCASVGMWPPASSMMVHVCVCVRVCVCVGGVRVCVCECSRTHTEMHVNERIRPRVQGGLYNQEELQGNKKGNHESAQTKLKTLLSSRQT